MKSKSPRNRLDLPLVERGLAESQQKAQAMILAGEVRVNDIAVQKAGMPVASDARIEVKSRQLKYASRGGIKLEGALEDFSIDPAGLVCLDVGSVHRRLHRLPAAEWRIARLRRRCKRRPTRLEAPARSARHRHRTQRARTEPEDIPEPVDLVVADVSFISVCKILAPASACAKPGANLLILVKPQFELRREDVGPGGIVNDVRLHEKAIASVRKCAEAAGLDLRKCLAPAV